MPVGVAAEGSPAGTFVKQDTASQGLFWRHGIGKLSVQLNSLHARSQSGPPSLASPEPGIQ